MISIFISQTLPVDARSSCIHINPLFPSKPHCLFSRAEASEKGTLCPPCSHWRVSLPACVDAGAVPRPQGRLTSLTPDSSCHSWREWLQATQGVSSCLLEQVACRRSLNQASHSGLMYAYTCPQPRLPSSSARPDGSGDMILHKHAFPFGGQ